VGAKILQIEYHLPERLVTNKDLEAEFEGWNAEKIEKKTGIRERRVVREDETALDMALTVSSRVLTGFDKDKIDYLILNTQSPEYIMPSSSCLLHNRLGLRTDVGAIDVNLGCSGFVYGLSLSKGLIAAGIAKNVLLVTSETYSKHIHPKDKGNRTIFGDGAAAAIIQQSDQEGILAFSLGTQGNEKDIIVPWGATKHRYDPGAEEIADPSGSIRTANNFYMNGPDVFNFTIQAIPPVYHDILEKNALTVADVDYVIFHQANEYMIEYLRKKLQIPEEKFYKNMLLTGNTVASTIPIALKDSLDRGLIKKGNKVLILGFGVGYSWGGTVLNI
jgi:3-oxoacyl-[acyl-carrier-protein] synthase-3